tara:strand:- start:1745 stop:2086 length:342 start_codon:yes stop_codon:yes gene_type:complete
MRKDTKIFLLHILESIERIESFTKGVSETKFLSSEIIQDAVVRRLEIIGEAVKNISKSYRDKHKEIEWKKIAGTRDIIVHEYFGVDLKLTFKIIKKDIPELKKNISKFLEELS